MNSYSLLPYVLQSIMGVVARPILWAFAGLTVAGKENLKGVNNGAIIAINHLSDLDPILIPATLGPRSKLMPVFSVAHERSYYNRPWPLNYLYGGMVFNMLGAYAVRVGTKGDFEHILKAQIDILEAGGSVGIFPEGSKAIDGKIGEGKPGVSFLSWRTGCPIIPVAVHGHHEMSAEDFFSRKHTVSVSYGKPITKEELFGADPRRAEPTREEFRLAAQVVMARIHEMYIKI